jgi:hypothetical protein
MDLPTLNWDHGDACRAGLGSIWKFCGSGRCREGASHLRAGAVEVAVVFDSFLPQQRGQGPGIQYIEATINWLPKAQTPTGPILHCIRRLIAPNSWVGSWWNSRSTCIIKTRCSGKLSLTAQCASNLHPEFPSPTSLEAARLLPL